MKKSTSTHLHSEAMVIFGVVLILFAFLFSAENSRVSLVGQVVTTADDLKSSQLDQKQVVLYLIGGAGVVLLLAYFYLRRNDVQMEE